MFTNIEHDSNHKYREVPLIRASSGQVKRLKSEPQYHWNEISRTIIRWSV